MIRAVICDVYGTLLKVNPGPRNADFIWEAFWQKQNLPTPVSWEQLPGILSAMVSAVHRRAKFSGEEHPEVRWHVLLSEACGVGHWSESDQRSLCFLEAKLSRKCDLMPGAAMFLTDAQEKGMVLGICSNGQSCTETELLEALLAHRVDVDEVFPAHRFWSYQHGFAKPSHKPFAWLEKQLADAAQISPHEILMIGDNPDNDLAPAQARGWQTHYIDENAPCWPE